MKIIKANRYAALSDSKRLKPPSTPMDRQRLFALLAQRRQQQPCVWISAAAGYGKTSLLTSYLSKTCERYLWYGLRVADSDLVRFFQNLTQFFKAQFPELELPEISLINLLGPEVFGEVFFNALNGLKLTIVLDDYHCLAAESPVHKALASGMESLESGSWLIASRLPPPAPLTRLVANSIIGLIATNELKFTLKETQQLLTQHKLVKLSDEYVNSLQTLSEGWAAGLVLLMKQEQLGHLPKTVDGLVFQYFRHEVLSQFDSSTRRFLMICALIPDITAYQAEELTGRADAEPHIERLARICEFVKWMPGRPPSYRFHSLFRDVLTELSLSELGENALADYQRRAVSILIDQHQFDTAVELLVNLKDWPRLAELIEAQAERLLSQGRVHTLTTWIEAAPKQIITESIWLGYWRARCNLPFAPAATRREMENLLIRFQQVNDSKGVYLTWSYIVEAYFIERNEIEPLDDWLKALDELDQRYVVPDELQVRARVLYARYIITTIRTHDPYNWIDDEMIDLLSAPLPANQKVAYATQLVFRIACLIQGREHCEKVRAIIGQLLAEEEVSPMERFVWSMSGIIYDYIFGEQPPSLSKSLIEAKNIGKRHGFSMLWHTYQLIVAQALCIEGRGSDAERALAPLLNGLGNVNLNVYGHLKLALAHCFIVNGRPERAMEYALESLRIARRLSPNANIQSLLAVAHAAMELDNVKQALANLALARRICRQTGNRHLYFSASLFLASIAENDGRLQRAKIILLRAFAIGQHERYRRYFMQRPDALARLCVLALEGGIYSDYARSLIRANALKAPADRVCEAWPRPVRIMALGPLRVEVNGEPLIFQRKAQAKPMELLKVLIVTPDLPLSVEKVALVLWPEANPCQAKVNVKSTLHRLRKLLGTDAVVLQEGNLHLNPTCCWLDTASFKRLLEPSTIDAMATEKLEDTLRLYRGPLLGDDALPDCAIHLRLELDRYFLNSVQHLAQRLIAKQMVSKAIDWLLKGLEIDPYSESLALELLNVYRRLNRKSEAAVFYQQFRERLFKELDVEPNEALQMVAASMR